MQWHSMCLMLSECFYFISDFSSAPCSSFKKLCQKVRNKVAKDLLALLRTHARRQGVSTETLINLWL
ncbi:MAG: hypothetical protein L6282_11800, partial [Candidatus Methanoperedenaceae archaeon]|nr:hypothetical protein [Candidatus Methanoperedenaceae archaeon]